MKKRYIATIIAVLFAYFLSLSLLVYAESFSPDANILNIKDALWYSIVTLTTVGYGDLSPVTGRGKIIGSLFLLLSTSLLAILVALIMTFGQVFARLRLSLRQKDKWYIFSHVTPQTVRLATSIKKEKPSAVLIFPKEDSSDGSLIADLKQLGAFLLKGSVGEAVLLKKSKENCNLFFMGADTYINYSTALEFVSSGYKLYCRSDYQPQTIPANMVVFTGSEILARLYWQEKPLERDSKNVVVIGGGEYGQCLLAQALQVNVFAPQQAITYHLFADSRRFIQLHPQLSQVISIDKQAENTDTLFCYDQHWSEYVDIITTADRVILWSDNEEENLKNYGEITKHFALSGKIHMRLALDLPDADCFGSHSQLYTTNLVMRQDLDSVARTMHNIYLQSTGATSPEWEELSAFTQNSNISSADHLQTKIRMLLEDDSITDVNGQICAKAYKKYLETKEEKADLYRRVEHMRWMRFHALHNWSYAPVRNNSRRQHPSMVPFEKLNKSEQSKDDYSWQLLEHLAQTLG